MKKLFLGLLAISSMAMVSCSQDDEQWGLPGATFEDFTGEIVTDGSRTSMGTDGSVLWSENDTISLFKKTGYHQKYKVAESGSTSTTFQYGGYSSGKGATHTMHYAVYPFAEGNSISGTTLTLDLSSLATQSYTANTFENGKAVMVAKSENTALAFTNAFSLANFQLKAQAGEAPEEKILVNSIKVESATLPLAGTATVDMAQEKPAAEFASTGSKSITLTCENAVELSATTATNFYVLMPAVTFPANDLTITIHATVAEEAKEYVVTMSCEVPLLRSKVTTLTKTLEFDGWTGATSATVVDVADVTAANTALETNAGVKIADASAATEQTPIIVPAKETEAAAEAPHVVDLSAAVMPSNNEPVYIAVEEGDGSATNTVETLEVIVPEGTTGQRLNINAPGTTVTITTADGTVIDVIEAATANNTLIISKDVEVTKLVVKKGNVRLEDGAIVGEIVRSEDNTDAVTYVYCEGIVPENVKTGENVILLSADFIKTSDTSYEVNSVAGLKIFGDAVNAGNSFAGCTIKLTNDLDLSNEQWSPIGTSENPFKGTFCGSGSTIKNLDIVETEAKEGKAYIGFFGYAKDVAIKDVTFENVNLNIACLDIDHSQGHIGAVAGSLEGASTIENVTVKGDIKVEATFDANGASRVAVVAGGNSYGNVTMKNVHVIANEGSYLKANNNTGALAGQLQGKNVFENCSSNIDVTVKKFFAGGIIGLAAGDSQFTNCHTTGDVTVTAGREGKAHDHYRVGGIAGGWADGAKKVCTLNDCSYTGKLSGTNADGSVAEAFDYAGYVGRGYTLNGCKGSKVVIDGVEYVQAYNTAAEAGIYYINGLISVASGVALNMDGEYVISNAEGMFWVATEVNVNDNYFSGKTIKLGAIIDLDNKEWTPIGSAVKDHGFMGNFDGNGYAIKNLSITNIDLDADGYAYAGLFGVTEGTDANNENYIKNLVIENVNINTTGKIVAAAIAYPYYTTIENITVKGNVTIKGGDYTAGVLAYTRRCVNAKDLTIEGDEGSSIEGAQTVGGVISDIQMNGGLTANYSNFAAFGLTIKATSKVGGISGIIAGQSLDGATVKNVTIEGGDTKTGVVAGALGAKSNLTNVSYENVTGATRVIGATYDEGYYVGQIVEASGVKGIIYTIEDGVKAVSVAQGGEMVWDEAKAWAEKLGEGWSLTSMDDLKAIHSVRVELNKSLAADSSDNVLFEEDNKEEDNTYAAYWSSDLVEGTTDATSKAYYMYFDTNGRTKESFTIMTVDYSRAVYKIK